MPNWETQKREGIMLAYPFEEKRLEKWNPPYIIQPKLDGERCRAEFCGPLGYNLASSQMNYFQSVPHIIRALNKTELRLELDGELYCHGMIFEDIHSIVSRTVNLHSNHEQMEFHIFDIIINESQLQRSTRLYQRIVEHLHPPLKLVPMFLAENFEDIMRCYDQLLNKGYEGIIVRNVDAPYVRKRSTFMMKFKPKKKDVYPIKGYSVEMSIEGIIKPDLLGRLICDNGELNMPILGEYPPHTKLPEGYFGVGSGPTEDKRRELWKQRETLPGNYVSVKYQHITPGKGVPRFPIYLDIVKGGLENGPFTL